MVQDADAQAVLNPIKLFVRVTERKLSSRLPHQMAKNYCAWSTSKNRDIIKTGRKMDRKTKVNKKIYVANLPPQTTEAELRTLFSKAGSVMSVNIVKDRQTGQPRGIAFVEMSTQWEGRRAASMLNRTDFKGKNLLVKEAIVRRDFRGR